MLLSQRIKNKFQKAVQKKKKESKKIEYLQNYLEKNKKIILVN